MVMMAAGPVSAGNIVLESYTGQRPADANRLLGPVLEELSARGFDAGDGVARKIEGQVSKPAQTSAGLPADFAAQVDRGFKAWVGGNFNDAIKILTPLIEAAHANTGVFVKDQSLRDPLAKALIVLAIAQQRTGDPGTAKGTYAEVARAFPGMQVTRGTYGPDAATMFADVQRELAAAGQGTLTVNADSGAVVFVDELYRGAATTKLPAGEYRVSVMFNSQPSRSHRVTVAPNGGTTLAIDAGLDQALHTDGWTGFSFASDADREAHEGPYASKLAVSLNASAVAVVGIENVKGHSAVVGSLVSLSTGREIRRASVAMAPDPATAQLKALARYLAGEEATGGIEVQPIEASSPIETKGGGMTSAAISHHDEGEPAQGGRWGGWKWITGGVAVAGLGTGAALLGIDGRCASNQPVGTTCTNVYDTQKTGFIALGAGAVFAGVSIYLFATQPSHPAKTAFVAPTGDGAIAGVAGSW
jgi:hypothetical protein